MFFNAIYGDNCAYIIDNDDNKKPHELVKDDITKFNTKKRQYEGKVIDFSSNSDFLQKRRQDFNKTIKQKKKINRRKARSLSLRCIQPLRGSGRFKVDKSF
ncbi:unnamed protein product [Arctia plantaginis]|uniref:Uncharacterized protein n=1 Tax=Arctia plantaginis TaxID=874455 RepID=A0A8S1BG19_ARCPL|nr:unnamed protein product [Arctia plantaginis]